MPFTFQTIWNTFYYYPRNIIRVEEILWDVARYLGGGQTFFLLLPPKSLRIAQQIVINLILKKICHLILLTQFDETGMT